MAERKSEAVWIENRKRWQINAQSDGERRTFVCATPGRKGKIAAEKKADKWLEEKLVGENTKCEVLLDKYFNHVKATTTKANWRQIDNYVRNHIKPVIGRKKIGRLTENDLQDVIDQAYSSGLAKKTLSNIRACLMAFMKFCRRSNATKLHPEGIVIPNGAKRSSKSIADPDDLKVLFSSDQTTWRSTIRFDRYIHAYRFAALTGIRPGELLGLKWSDIDGEKISIRRALNDDDEFTVGKNENAQRTFVVKGLAKSELDQQHMQLLRDGILSEFVFPDKHAEFTKQHTFRRFWNRYRSYNNISGITPYELRHTFVSVNDEMPEGLKKKVIGHSPNMDTEGTYGHAIAGDMERAAQYSDNAFRRILGEK
ncbi:MAG: tyrosine-type recombinase/integrase [Oscillibacter ruminantium]|uniref:tyrosine-type recombinase/integrase n=1 Tax=Oscillibacter ruminantium TaxID=1263547 RepID=UPI002B1FC8E2|nr:tyrosine-type recombinase/integrase [Oscillibacter ruminantium]MEA5041590.1 tyrosine-type recombinase/integrase [Oscillibacter ruminantium]